LFCAEPVVLVLVLVLLFTQTFFPPKPISQKAKFSPSFVVQLHRSIKWIENKFSGIEKRLGGFDHLKTHQPVIPISWNANKNK
jgi:hypothetical protein